MNRIFILLFTISFFTNVNAQEILTPNPTTEGEGNNNPQQTSKGTFYITGGYNFDWYAKSTLHLKDHTATNQYNVKS